MQCHVGLYFLSNSFLMYAAMSFSMLYLEIAFSLRTLVPKPKRYTKEREDTEEDERDEGEGGRAAATGMDNTEQTGATSNGSHLDSLLKGSGCAVDGLLLHVLGHVRILEYCLAVRHLKSAKSRAMFSVPNHRIGAFRNATTNFPPRHRQRQIRHMSRFHVSRGRLEADGQHFREEWLGPRCG